jgi:hypothetical protein
MSLLLLLNQDSSVGLQTSVQRAPFSELGIADRVEQDPATYRSLALMVADALQRDIDRLDTISAGSDSNSVAVTKGELKRLQEGFREVAQVIPDSGPLTRSAAEKVGQIVAALRNGFIAWYEGNKEIAITAQKLASVTLATCALHMFGASTELAMLVSYAVVEKVSLVDILKALGKKGE